MSDQVLKTTVGQLLINEALPEDLRDYQRVLDKKSVAELFRQIQHKYPDRYREILHEFMKLGADFASTKGLSVSLKHVVPGPRVRALREELRHKHAAVVQDPKLTDDEKEQRILELLKAYYPKIEAATIEDQKESGSPYYVQVSSGGRGNPAQLNQMAGAELVVADHQNKLIPIPVFSSYGEGLTPVEYWGSVYGTRRGVVSTKFSTAAGGFLGKQLALAAHRFVVNREKPPETRLPVGIPVSIDDDDLSGSVLAHAAGPYKPGTILTPRIIADLKAQGISKILVHSPLTAFDEDGGIDKWSAGVRERMSLPNIGDNVGVTAAQAISEPITQSMLSEKHSAGGGKVGKNLGGFDFINKMLQGPESFAETGPLAPKDGIVKEIRKAPQGGHYVVIDDQEIYVRPQHDIIVKPGQRVYAGDDVTNAMPHPMELVKYRGVGEARRVFSEYFRKALKDSGIKAHRRNVDTVIAGLINHIRVTNIDGFGDHIVDDIVPFNRAVATYKPRPDAQLLKPSKAIGKYLEEPVLHYTPGTRITPRVAKELEEWHIRDVYAHDEHPGFEGHWERLMTTTVHDPDWQTRLGGFYIGRAFTDAVLRGAASEATSTSYFPALAKGVGFGKQITTTGKY